MGKYIVRRLLVYIAVLFLMTILVFFLAVSAPGDPVDYLANPDIRLTPQQQMAMRESLGLNAPLPVRYLKWLGQTLHGDFGFRLKNKERIAPLVWLRVKRTFSMALIALTFSTVIGISLGIITALRQYSILDHLLNGVAFLGISTPSFMLGLLALWIFAVELKWFPTGGMVSPGGNPNDILDYLRHLFLPAAVLATGAVASKLRYMRMSMLEVLHSDYLATARAKGLAERAVILRHALRNALLPMVTVVALQLPWLLGGSLFVETIFSWPGMGLLFIDGVVSRDYPLIMAMALIDGVAVLLANLLADIVYSVVDPRIRLEGGSH